MSKPNFTVWLPKSLVRFDTTCHCFSSWANVQLQRFTPRPEPMLKPRSPLMNMPDMPDVKVSSTLRPGTPASVMGWVP